MKRTLLSVVAAATLIAGLAAPATASTTASTSATQTGLGQNCPSIVDGDGAYVYQAFGLAAPTVSFYFDLSAASCKSTDYTISFLPTDGAGTVISSTPVFSQSWRGDGVATMYTATNEFPTVGYPAGLCVFATATKGGNVLHYAPSGDPATTCVWLELDPTSSGGQPFRG